MSAGNPTLVFPKPREVVIEDRPVPDPREGEVLVRTRVTLVSTGTELTILSGDFPRDSEWSKYGEFPFVPGYSNVGEVVRSGEGSEDGLMGKRVFSLCPHATYVTAQAESLMVVPDSVSDEQASFFTIAEISLNGVRRGGVSLGESVVVYGAGLIGQFTARFCRLSGATPVFVVDVSDDRLSKLPEDPDVVRLNPLKEDIASAVKSGTGGRMADLVFEVTGDPGLIPGEFKCLRKQGRFVVLSSPRGPTLFDFHDLCNRPSCTIIGAHLTSQPRYSTPDNPWTSEREGELFFHMVEAKELVPEQLVTHRVNYRRAPEMYQALLRDRSTAMGVLIDWT